LQTTTLPLGAQSLTATYNGSTDFLGKTSQIVTVTELSPQFTLTASPASQNVLPGHSAAFTLTLTPVNPTFVQPVQLSISSLPATISANFTLQTIATGAGTSTSVLTLSASPQASLHPTLPTSRLIWLASLLPFGLLLHSGIRRRHALIGLLLMLGLTVVLMAASCGSGGYYGHKAQSYPVTVTAISGSVTQTTNLTLTVQ
jgi:hypothetical protein